MAPQCSPNKVQCGLMYNNVPTSMWGAHLAHKQRLAVSADKHKRDPPVPLSHKREASGRHPTRLPGVRVGGGDVGLLAVALELREAPDLGREGWVRGRGRDEGQEYG